MRILRGCMSQALLIFAKVKGGRVASDEMRKTAHAMARSPNAANNALKRLVDSGYFAVEYRITAAGEKALQEAQTR